MATLGCSYGSCGGRTHISGTREVVGVSSLTISSGCARGFRVQNSFLRSSQHVSGICSQCGLDASIGPGPKSIPRLRTPGVRATYAPDAYAKGTLDGPPLTGDGFLSKLANILISIKPLYALMKYNARSILIRTAEESGIAWRDVAERLRKSPELVEEKERLENKSIIYPDYYLQEFHAYKKGNLCWEAAYEVESATLVVSRRALKEEPTAEAAANKMRGGWLAAIRQHHEQFSGGLPVKAILDIGCGAGISTRFLANAYPKTELTGVDLSPYLLAVAAFRDREAACEGRGRRPPVRWLHALGEDTKLPVASFDMVSFAFMIHECPEVAIRALFREAKRLLRPGGTVSFTDNDPMSKVIQELPPAVFTLMKSTEPWSDEYYRLDMEAALREAGFRHVATVLTDPRHRTVTATA